MWAIQTSQLLFYSWREKERLFYTLANSSASLLALSGGRLCSFQTPSELPAQCYRGGLWGEWGRALTQGRWTAACLSPALSCFIWAATLRELNPIAPAPGVIGYEYPVKSGWWEDVNILLMFQLLICSLTRRIMANGRFPEEWSSSSESHWLTEAEQVGREIGRTREGCGERGRLCERHTRWREGYYTQTARERSVKRWESEIQMQTSVKRRLPEQSVIGGRMDLTQRRCWQLSFAGPSDAAASSWGPVIIWSHIQKNAASNLT